MGDVNMGTELLNYLELSICNVTAKQKFGFEDCSLRFRALLSSLSSPPAFTTLRLNTHINSAAVLCAEVAEQLREQYCSLSREPPRVFLHPQLADCCIIENQGPYTPEPVDSEVMIDISCGMAVMRGANIFMAGILAMSPGVERGDKVSVYIDVDGRCRKGLMKRFEGVKVYAGNGLAQVSRRDVFVNDAQLSAGVGVQMTDPVYVALSLAELPRDKTFPQNLPSLVCVHVLDPQEGDLILDMCAAPGGKVSHIATKMNDTGRVIALDKSRNKIAKLTANIHRWNVNCVEVYCFDATKALDKNADIAGGPPYPPSSFDRILLDAPCSGLGQRPAISIRQSLTEVTSYPPLQRRLFETAVSLLKPGGVLVYSTCTITVDENETMVAWAVRTFSQQLQLVEQTPHIAGPGWPCEGLLESDRILLQRFDPSVERSADRSYDSDTIGFFIAKFVKL